MAVLYSKTLMGSDAFVAPDVAVAKTTLTTNKIKVGNLITQAGAKGFSHSTAASSVKPTHYVVGSTFTGIRALNTGVVTGDIATAYNSTLGNLNDGNPALDPTQTVLKLQDVTNNLYRSEVVTQAVGTAADTVVADITTVYATIGGTTPTYATIAAARTALLGKYLQLVNITPSASVFGDAYITNAGASAVASASAFALVTEVAEVYSPDINRNIAQVTFKIV